MVDKEKGNVTSERLTTYQITRYHTTEEQNMNFPENNVLKQTFVNFMFLVRTPCYTIYDIYLPLHVLAPRCPHQGVIITKVYEPTCQSSFCSPDRND